MKTLLLGLLLSATVATAQAQNPKNVLVADETTFTLMASGDSKIVTSNQEISELVQTKYKGKIKRFSAQQKEDKRRHVFYWEHVIVIEASATNNVVDFFNSINNPIGKSKKD